MQTDSLVQVTPHGLYVPAADLYLDAQRALEYALSDQMDLLGRSAVVVASR